MSNSGIYQIVNTINKKIYIGSTNNFENRKRRHFNELKSNKHYNVHLQNAYNKYGKDNFIFEIIEYVKHEKLLEREQYWIDKLNVTDYHLGYNQNPIANKPPSFLGKKHSKETVNAMRLRALNMSDEQKNMIRNSLIGKSHSKERILNIKNGKRKSNGKKVINIDTKEIFNSIIEAHEKYPICNYSGIIDSCNGKINATGGYKWAFVIDGKIKYPKYINKHTRSVINLNTNEIFISINNAARFYNIKHVSGISNVCKGKSKTCNGFKWAYVNNKGEIYG